MTKEQPTKKTEKFESKPEGSRRSLRLSGCGVANVTSRRDNPIPKAENLMEAVVEDKNVEKALHRVEANKGTAGIDNMSLEQLRPYLHKYWPILRVKLLEGRYKPQAVKVVDIPKPSGGKRTLGIPTAVDRFIQQAIKQAQNYVASGRRWLVDITTVEKKTRLNIAKESVKRFKKAVKEIFRRGRGHNIGRFINDELNPLLRGWGNYFRLNQVKAIIEMLDGWIRRKLRCMLWRQWKRFHTRKKRLKARGLSEEQARLSAGNGRGAWWNSGVSHMNKAFPKRYFDAIGLVVLRKIMICL